MPDRLRDQRLSHIIEYYFGLLMQLIGMAGFAVIILGSIIGFIQDGSLPTSTASLLEIPGGVISGDATAIITLGLLLLLIAPVISLGWLVRGYRRIGDQFYSRLSIAIIAVIAASVLVALLTRGG